MTIGITGSVGFLGANLVRALHRRLAVEDRIVCFYSRRRNNPLTRHLDLTYHHLDITSAEEVREKTRDLDLLFHLAGVVDYSRKNARRTWDVNVLGTKNILDGVLHGAVPKLVFAASINVLGPVGPGLDAGNETNPIYRSSGNPISFSNRAAALAAVESSVRGDYEFLRRSRATYFDSKLAAYELARRYSEQCDLPVTIVLPGTAVGAGDVGVSITGLVMQTFYGKLKITLPGCTSFVAAGDVAEGISLASVHGRTGQAYIITGAREDNLSYLAFMELVAKVARTHYHREVPGRFWAVPRRLCRPLATLLRILRVDGMVSEALVLSGAAEHRFGNRKAEEELGYFPKIPLEQAIRSCIDFYLEDADGKA